MCSVFQLMRSIGQRRKGHIPVRLEAQAPAAVVHDFRPAHAGARAALLRYEITGQIVLRRCFKNSQPCPPTTVAVVFFRTKTIVAHPVIIRVQLHHYAEFRHVSQAGYGVVAQGNAHGSTGVYRIAQGALRGGDGSQRVSIVDGHRTIPVFPGHGMRIFPGQLGRALDRSVQRGDFPLRVPLGHAVAAVVVGGSTPEVGTWNGFEHLLTAIHIGDQPSGEVAEQNAETVALYPGVEIAADDAERPANRRCRASLHLVNALSKGNLVSAGGPWRILLETEGQGDGIFSGFCLFFEGQMAALTLHRGDVDAQRCRVDHNAVPRKRRHTGKGRGRGEEASVGDDSPCCAHAGHDALIVVLDLLHLGAFGPVPVNDAVARKVVIARAVVKVAAIAIGRLTVAVLVEKALIDEIPHKSALIKGLLVGIFGVFVHGAVGIAHCMRIFAQNKRPIAVFGQIGADFRNGRIHPADHVAGFGIARVVENTLVMHEAGGIERAQMAAQLVDDPAAEGLVSTAPEQHAGMVLVPLIEGIHAVRQPGQIFHTVPRKGVGHRMLAPDDRFPHAMRFQVGFVHHVQAQFIAQGVEGALVGIVAGTDGVDVIALHGEQVAADGIPPYGTACFGTEIVPVHSL